MIANQRWMLMIEGLGITLLIAACAIVIGTILGCTFALMKISEHKILRILAEIYTTVLRGIPLA
ncbi:MAG: ABC transporter permease subunit, partial [Treponema sp.]|nr:ABC transporter permease subunit [Treponema sp.]